MADDRELVPEGFRRLLESDFELVGTTGDERTLVTLAVELRPDAVLLDISIPMLDGFELGRQIRRLAPSVKLILVTMHPDHVYPKSRSRTGPSAYLLKRSTASEAAEAGPHALSDSGHLAPLSKHKDSASSAVLRKAGGAFTSHLSNRERQVLRLIAEGRQVKEIAHLLHISHKTVEFHKQRIVLKLGLRTTAELTRYAVRQGLVEA